MTREELTNTAESFFRRRSSWGADEIVGLAESYADARVVAALEEALLRIAPIQDYRQFTTYDPTDMRIIRKFIDEIKGGK